MSVDEDLLRDLQIERFGQGVPWRERTAKPTTEQPLDNDLTKAQRRSDLNDAMEDVDQRFRRGRHAA